MPSNSFEKGPERIPTKGEVLDIISRFVESPVIVRESSDAHGLCLLETRSPGERPGESVECLYMRKGAYPDGNQTAETSIHVVYLEGEMPVGGHNVADLDPAIGEWKLCE